jgi:Ca2+-binding RTX toxin-like protein
MRFVCSTQSNHPCISEVTVNAPAGSVVGTAAGDILSGTTNGEYIFGLGGDDAIGADAGNDTVFGGAGNDTVNGGNGNDFLPGGIGGDTLSGSNGNDTICGGDGLDVLRGNAAADTFLFEGLTALNNIDVIKDFNLSQGDKIDIHEVLSGYDPINSALADFVRIANSGHDSLLSIDRDATGSSYGWTQIATIEKVTGISDESALVADGLLIVS